MRPVHKVWLNDMRETSPIRRYTSTPQSQAPVQFCLRLSVKIEHKNHRMEKVKDTLETSSVPPFYAEEEKDCSSQDVTESSTTTGLGLVRCD